MPLISDYFQCALPVDSLFQSPQGSVYGFALFKLNFGQNTLTSSPETLETPGQHGRRSSLSAGKGIFADLFVNRELRSARREKWENRGTITSWVSPPARRVGLAVPASRSAGESRLTRYRSAGRTPRRQSQGIGNSELSICSWQFSGAGPHLPMTDFQYSILNPPVRKPEPPQIEIVTTHRYFGDLDHVKPGV